jgi:hypothetical protein
MPSQDEGPVREQRGPVAGGREISAEPSSPIPPPNSQAWPAPAVLASRCRPWRLPPRHLPARPPRLARCVPRARRAGRRFAAFVPFPRVAAAGAPAYICRRAAAAEPTPATPPLPLFDPLAMGLPLPQLAPARAASPHSCLSSLLNPQNQPTSTPPQRSRRP